MKKIHLLSFLFVFCVGSVPLISLADTFPEGSHPISQCTKIVNINSFPEIVLIARFQFGPHGKTYKVENDKCLETGYLSAGFGIYWVPLVDFNPADLEGLTINDKWNKLALNARAVSDRIVKDENPLIKETIEHSLAKSITGKIYLYQSKQIQEFNDGSPAKIKTFNSPSNTEADKKPQTIDVSPSEIKQPEVLPLKRPSFWRRFACMLGLFKTC